MAAKIPVQIHIGVTPLPLPAGRTHHEMRVTLTENGSGTVHSDSISADQAPVPDEFGNLHFVVDFQEVQSGEAVHVDVRCVDANDALIGTPVTHDVTLPEVQEETYPQPSSIFLTT